MSFKRDGDDASQLNALKKRRVSDLLAFNIPQEEALLLSNGRFACTVCSWRPVFDTMDVLAVHRAGKRHLASLCRFNVQQQCLREEIQKRRQAAFLQEDDSDPAPLLSQTRHRVHCALLRSIPYNSCCQRGRRKTAADGDSTSAFPEKRMDKPCEGPSHNKAEAEPDTAPLPPVPEQSLDHFGDDEDGTKYDATSTEEKVTRRRELEHYLHLRSSGWVKDKAGCWVKDENAEFDSDEDQPPQSQSS
uniref:sodium channel modifier 1 isoform X2 n=1 Tax=Myxine glutinosa TaxID=7769 RepID=UPI00358FF378